MVGIVLEQKLEAYSFYINRVITLPITEQAKINGTLHLQ